ncbi:MAG: methyl-accepting chemotaxis protein [Phycisphaerae bacterium]|jgi:methyl-accepting chemotaxis protein
MLKRLTVGARIALGFATVLALLVVMGGMSMLTVRSLATSAEEAREGNELDTQLADVEVAHLEWAGKVNALLSDPSVTELAVQTDDHKCSLGQWLYGEERQKAEQAVPEIAPLLKEIEGHHAALHHTAIEIKDAFQPADPTLATTLALREIDHLAWADKIRDLLLGNAAQLDVQTDPAKCGFGKWLSSDEARRVSAANPELAKLLAAIATPHEQLHRSAEKIAAAWNADDAQAKSAAQTVFNEQTLPALAEVRGKLDECRQCVNQSLAGAAEATDVFYKQTKPALASVQSLLHDVRERVRKHVDETRLAMQTSQQRAQMGTAGLALAAIVIGGILAFFISRGIVKTLRRVIVNLDAGANQVSEASSQVSSAAQQLAEGASEQASSLEETSAALEQMTAMTRTNAENAKQATHFTGEAREAVQTGGQTTAQLNEAMSAINESATQVSKIVKAIEEIAFQTNLLALNAAVEAARAGEQGKGFAVVAEEVRNLAMRSAEAARETTTLIEGSVQRARQGTTVAGEVTNVLTAITGSVARIAELIDGIASASDEQAQGVEQISTAVSQMDRVTQNNAAGAEESASASEELNAQATSLRNMVNALVALVGGATHETGGAPQNRRPAARAAASEQSVAAEQQESAEFSEF